MKNIDFLLQYAKGNEELANKIANKLWVEFGIHNSELVLLCLLYWR